MGLCDSAEWRTDRTPTEGLSYAHATDAQELIVGQVATDFTHQITMSSGSSTSWTTPRAVRDVNIPRPEVADVVPQSDRTLLITGWAPGQTQIFLARSTAVNKSRI